MSLGEKTRVNLLHALYRAYKECQQKKIVIIDEPTAGAVKGTDSTTERIFKLIADLKSNELHDCFVIVITHDDKNILWPTKMYQLISVENGVVTMN